MNQTDCFAGSQSTSSVENYRDDWMEAAIERATKPLVAAIKDALNMLGTGECRANHCEGCKAETHYAIEHLREALRDL